VSPRVTKQPPSDRGPKTVLLIWPTGGGARSAGSGAQEQLCALGPSRPFKEERPALAGSAPLLEALKAAPAEEETADFLCRLGVCRFLEFRFVASAQAPASASSARKNRIPARKT